MATKVVTFVLAGGAGNRLLPLAEHCAKPAVPFAGKYRIIDFALSNLINSGCAIYVRPVPLAFRALVLSPRDFLANVCRVNDVRRGRHAHACAVKNGQTFKAWVADYSIFAIEVAGRPRADRPAHGLRARGTAMHRA